MSGLATYTEDENGFWIVGPSGVSLGSTDSKAAAVAAVAEAERQLLQKDTPEELVDLSRVPGVTPPDRLLEDLDETPSPRYRV